jgi:hypothetical protein
VHALGRRPLEQLPLGVLARERAALHPQLEQVLVRLADDGPGGTPSSAMMSSPVRSGRIRPSSSFSASRAIRASRSSYAAARAAARRRLRVVQSDRTSLCSLDSWSPASVT